MNDIVLSPLLMASIPVVVGVVSIFKGVGLSGRWAPVVSLGLGLILAIFAGNGSVLSNILEGLIVGLSASGAYSGVKATVN